MPDEGLAHPPTEPATEPAAAVAHLPTPSRRALHFEIAAVLCIAALPDLYSALQGMFTEYGDNPFADRIGTAVSLTVRAVSVCVPVLWIMHKSGVPWARYGIVRPRLRFDIPFGLLLAIGGALVAMACGWCMWQSWWVLPLDEFLMYGYAVDTEEPGMPGPAGIVALVIGYIANSVGEELPMRAYLVTRVLDLTGSRWRAVAVSSTIFAAYHFYGGLYHVAWAFGVGVVYACAFVRFRRLWPLIIAHTAQNLWADMSAW